MDFRAKSTQTFLALAEITSPHDPKAIRPNTSQSFLCKVLKAMRQEESAAAPLPAKLEVLINAAALAPVRKAVAKKEQK